MRHWHSSERGDTLIEVTIALAILSAVLVSAFATANKAFETGQTAKERSQLVDAAQQQAEALKSFRDSHNWQNFIHGSGNEPACENQSDSRSYCGVHDRFNASAASCQQPNITLTDCFHMVQKTVSVGGVMLKQWVPLKGLAHIGLPSDYIGINAVSDAATKADQNAGYTFNIYYGEAGAGSQPLNQGMLPVELVNLDSLR